MNNFERNAEVTTNDKSRSAQFNAQQLHELYSQFGIPKQSDGAKSGGNSLDFGTMDSLYGPHGGTSARAASDVSRRSSSPDGTHLNPLGDCAQKDHDKKSDGHHGHVSKDPNGQPVDNVEPAQEQSGQPGHHGKHHHHHHHGHLDGDPGDQGSNPGSSGGQPGDQGNNPGNPGAKPGEHGGHHGHHGGKTGEHDGKPGEHGGHHVHKGHPGDGGGNPGNPGGKPGDGGGNPGNPGGKPGDGGGNPGNPGGKPGDGGGNPGNPGAHPGDHGIKIGAYVKPTPGESGHQAFLNMEKQLGHKLGIDHFYVGFGTKLDGRAAQDIKSGVEPMISMPAGNSKDIASGKDDKYLIALAKQIKADGGNVMFRYGYEMDNSHVEKNAGSPQDFVKAWQHIHDIFQKEGATNAKFVWCPTAQGYKTGKADQYWPGSKYVDALGADGYNRQEPNARSPQQIFQPFVDFAKNHAPGKPLVIGETGTVGTPQQKAQWLNELQNWSKTVKDMSAIVYWDSHGMKNWDYTINNPTDINAFKQLLQNG